MLGIDAGAGDELEHASSLAPREPGELAQQPATRFVIELLRQPEHARRIELLARARAQARQQAGLARAVATAQPELVLAAELDRVEIVGQARPGARRESTKIVAGHVDEHALARRLPVDEELAAELRRRMPSVDALALAISRDLAAMQRGGLAARRTIGPKLARARAGVVIAMVALAAGAAARSLGAGVPLARALDLAIESAELLAVELVLRAGVLALALALARGGREAARAQLELAMLDEERGAAQLVEQRSVVADQEPETTMPTQRADQRGPGLQVEVVVGLVEQEQVGLVEQRGGDLPALAFTG